MALAPASEAGTAMELTEDELIEAVAKVLSGEQPGVVLGIGDDAAVVEHGSGDLVLTTDMLIEGVHFELATIGARDLGAKAIAVNVSDVAGMGASPRYALVSLGLAPDVDAGWVVQLAGGMRAACDEYALSLVGGDTDRADAVVISVTVIGEVAPGRAVSRSGAQAGDLVVVTGALGAAAGGLALTRAKPSEAARLLTGPGRPLLEAFVRPVARLGEGQTLAQCGVTAMMDISDGLAKDLSRLCRASGVGARLEVDRLPVHPALVDVAPGLGVDARELALSGGEDYELLATIDLTDLEHARSELRERFGTELTEIGVVTEEPGLTAVEERGREQVLAPAGWDHFA